MEANKSVVKKYSPHIRLWHWLSALMICGSLITVMLNATIFDVRENTSSIKAELDHAKATVTQDQAKAVAHALEDKVWDFHIYFGYALAALFVYRLLFELFGKRENSFAKTLKYNLNLYFTKRVKAARHELGIKLLYLLFYAVLLIMVITGLSIAFDNEIGITKSFSHTLKEIHGFCMYLVLGFIVLHIGGVFFAERKDKKGVVSDMINGGNIND